MRFLSLGLLFFSLNALACWKMQGSISTNEDQIEINQKVDHDKTYSFPSGKHLFHLKIPSSIKAKAGVHTIEIGVQEKNGITLSQIVESKMIVKTGKATTMTKRNNESGEVTTFHIQITEI